MTTRFAVRLPHFFLGAFVLSVFSTLQTIILHGPFTLLSIIVPFCLGGFGGLLIGDRNTRLRQQSQSLRQSNQEMLALFQESEDRYHQLFASSPTVQLLIDPETGAIIRYNDAAVRFYGFSPGEFSGKTIFELNTAEPEEVRTNMRQAVAREQLCFRFRHRLRSGETRTVDVYTVPVPMQGRTLLHSMMIDTTERNQAKTNLQRKTLEQRLLLDSIPVCVWYLRDPQTFGSVNKAFADSCGRPPKEIAHKKLDTVLNPKMYALALMGNRKVFAEKTAHHYEQWVQLGNNEPRYMALTKTPKLSDTGEVDFVVCTATDITSMKQTQDLLQIERDLHVALSTATSYEEALGICLEKAIEVSQTDCGGLYLVAPTDGSLTLTAHRGLSDAFVQRVSHYRHNSEYAQIVQHNQPIYTDYADLARQAHEEILHDEGLQAIGMVPISFQGRVIACLNVASHHQEEIASCNRLALERIATHIGTFLVQKEQETQIRRHQRNLEALFNTIHDFVFILDGDGTIIYLNNAAADRLGYQPAELIGKNVLTVHPADRREEVLGIFAAMLAGTRDDCPVPLLTKTAELIPVETRVNRGQWSGRQVFFALSRDISSRLQIERQQQLLLKNEGLERMAGAMAHHFNNLMTIVAGNLELAQEDLAAEAGVSALLSNALTGSKRAIELGQALLLYVGQFAEVATSLNLSDFCRQQLDSSRIPLPGHIEFTVDLASPGPIVTADPAHLEQTLSALLTNALETIGETPGRIVLRVMSLGREAIGKAHIFPAGWTPTEARYGCLEITDTGTGIAEHRMVNIFDPFYSDKFMGRGLGLPLALSIVKKLNGAITVTSQPDRGSTFQVLLPEQDQTEQQDKQ